MEEFINKIKDSIGTNQFDDFCLREFYPQMERLEKNRLKKFLQIIITTLAIIPAVIYAYAIIMTLPPKLAGYCGIAVVIFISIVLVIYNLTISDYKSTVKQFMLDKLLSYIGDFKQADKETYTNDSIANYVKELKLFKTFNNSSFGDKIVGNYKGLNIEIIETDLYLKKEDNGGKTHTDIFKGILVKVPLTKEIFGDTVVLKKTDLRPEQDINVNIDNTEFEEYFNVYSNDQIEARSLLSKTFTDKIIRLKRSNLLKNDISFSFEKGMLNIAIESSKDWFEVPFMKSAKNLKNYRNIILEMITILSIVDALVSDDELTNEE